MVKKSPARKRVASVKGTILSRLKFWGPNPNDNMQNRRNLAFFSAIYSLVLWPNILLALHLIYELDISLIDSMLVYVGTVAGTSIGGYIWSALKEPKREEE